MLNQLSGTTQYYKQRREPCFGAVLMTKSPTVPLLFMFLVLPLCNIYELFFNI